MKRITLNFYGYTWEDYAFQISSLKGIFIVYKGIIDPEGFIDIKELLYVGYHNGIIELYEKNIIEAIKQYVNSSERIFLSYAEVPPEEDGIALASLMVNGAHPKYCLNATTPTSNVLLICEGNCKLIPEEIIG